ncbi:myrosinase 1-like [Aricia agestis]|uniref:myrosinase 1-like n=1 Tax=Aricia agestis TaxID=91739 RepID=UPI001C207C63|nr:myrosinase 1-like [Aricia agestis]
MQVYILLCFLGAVTCQQGRQFPEGFLFGASSSAYQYEGAWNEDGRGPSIWDVAIHNKQSVITDRSTADIATNLYHNYKNDIKLMTEVGLDFFRFSISWSRILPTGFANKINQAGIDYYSNFIDELIKNDITPFATIYHWDLPEKMQEMGGWTNPAIVDFFLDYAKIIFDNFGERVKFWVTINEPEPVCNNGYGTGIHAPFLNLSGIGEYMCAKNVLLAHARTYELYQKKYKYQNGKIGITLMSEWLEPYNSSAAEDRQAAYDMLLFNLGIFADPIFSKTGDFPQIVKKMVAEKSLKQGFPRSRLPTLSEDEVELIRGSADFMGLNIYSSNLVYRNESVRGMYPVPSFKDDAGVGITVARSWPRSNFERIQFVPWGATKILMKVKELYDNPTVYVTENGWPNNGGFDDEDRVHFLASYLNSIMEAVNRGCDVRGYSVWTLMDCFEWINGYTLKFGLYQVDYSSPNLTRTARKSAEFYKNITTTRYLLRDYDYNERDVVVNI